MTGKTCRRGMGIVVLASLLVAPAAQAASWWSTLGWEAPRASRIERDGGLRALWQRLTAIFQADDNRGTIDPNG